MNGRWGEARGSLSSAASVCVGSKYGTGEAVADGGHCIQCQRLTSHNFPYFSCFIILPVQLCKDFLILFLYLKGASFRIQRFVFRFQGFQFILYLFIFAQFYLLPVHQVPLSMLKNQVCVSQAVIKGTFPKVKMSVLILILLLITHVMWSKLLDFSVFNLDINNTIWKRFCGGIKCLNTCKVLCMVLTIQ